MEDNDTPTLAQTLLACILGCTAILGLIALTTCIARAHDHNRPDLTPWFETLQSKGGVPCCDGKDGRSVDDPDVTMTEDGKHFRVRLDGKWYDVPDHALVMVPNKDGHAIVWTYDMWDGDKHGYGIRCFMPGPMT